MKRLTEFRKDLNRYEYKQDEKGYCYISEGQIVNKLGKLEDLMQSYNVEDLEELDKLLGMATAYEELSKQLGCPLELLNAESVMYIRDNEELEGSVYGINLQKKTIMIGSAWSFLEKPLNQFGKTFWLREDKSE